MLRLFSDDSLPLDPTTERFLKGIDPKMIELISNEVRTVTVAVYRTS